MGVGDSGDLADRMPGRMALGDDGGTRTGDCVAEGRALSQKSSPSMPSIAVASAVRRLPTGRPARQTVPSDVHLASSDHLSRYSIATEVSRID
jgi:hypothetical protein